MRRRDFIVGLGSAVAWASVAGAQQRRRLPVIGVLWFSNFHFPMNDFRRGLADQGFVIGENVAIDFEFVSQLAQLPVHAASLVERRVDVIFVAPSLGSIRAAKSATTTIPIVFVYGGDPVEDGFVASLSRPSGNVTGLTSQAVELTSKRLGLLHELVPGATTIAFLTTSILSSSRDRVLAAAHGLGLNVLLFEANYDRDLERVFMDIVEQRAEALMVDNTLLALNSGRTIISLAERHKIPAVYPFLYHARSGGLISYDAAMESYRRAASQYIAPILKGAKASDLPVQQPTKFALVINLKTAKALGLTMPIALLVRADEVIE
jgi:putative ABC transport system substrate-binding protein